MFKQILFIVAGAMALAACSGYEAAEQKQDLLSSASMIRTSGVTTQPAGTTGTTTQPGSNGTKPSPTPWPSGWGPAPGTTNPLGGNGSQGSIGQPSGGLGTSGSIGQPSGGTDTSGDTSQPSASSGSVPVTLICSNNGTESTTSYVAALAAGDTVGIAVNGVVCTSDSTVVSTLLKSGKITLAQLGTYNAACDPASGAAKIALLINGTPQKTDEFAMSEASCNSSLCVIYDSNPGNSLGTPSGKDNSACTTSASPLVIHIAQNPAVFQPLDLSPAHAILFDLLGATDNHRKVRIDWLTNLDYRFLVLPNAQGAVNGIDELFGNNTTGPDGKTAANGYAALAKYDGMSADGSMRLAPAKGRIDRSDAVYPLLRVWLDANFDGIAQSDEMVSLETVNIDSIDLDYSKAYPEVDQYGNTIRMKSVVGLANGGMDLIFDLWFNYSN